MGKTGSFLGSGVRGIWEKGGDYFRDLVRYLVLIQPSVPLYRTLHQVEPPEIIRHIQGIKLDTMDARNILRVAIGLDRPEWAAWFLNK